ncbi:catalase [Serinicoccus sp. LYQ131]|uniref:catalase n=1 Tax=Serinicoccus sp. LYQ131 TaxID=3378797 RepID=UPI003851EB86
MSKSTPPQIPGAPASRPPEREEPTTPQRMPPPKPDQAGPARVTPTGAPTELPPAAVAQQGEFLTTSTGARLQDTDHSLKAGRRGPVLLQDHHLREKITHFDHERIPERVVHARGAGAHGVFVANGAGEGVCRAGFLRKGVETPVFTRFSTVLGSRGSADTVRDTRGFAVKFYTGEGTFDLVGNNIPVFFIQDGIKFPDVIHAAKPHPDREIPQAQSAHDTFWDFVSLHTEAQAHTMWNMSDRGIPRSYRTMEGFGVHTFRLVNAAEQTALVKFHWKPRQGVHSLVWEEAQLAAGLDPDFHRRDLADAIEAGAHPQWDLGVQVFPDTEDEMFEGIDLLDPTKFVPEELAPVQVIGTLTLTANPSNYFAETEQVAFHVGNLVPGVDVTNDPLLQVRLFSYIDTQLTRLGGPNYNQLPINRPHAPVNDMLRDGQHQSAVHQGVAPYRPNTLDGGCPFHAGAGDAAFVDIPVPVPASRKVREVPADFEDHFSQAALFFHSLTPVEQDHVIGAYTFELGRCWSTEIRERQLRALANIDTELCAAVAKGLGLVPPEPSLEVARDEPSPALSQVGGSWPVAGRQVALVVDETADASIVEEVRTALSAAGVVPLVHAPSGGTVADGTVVQRTYATANSTEVDAVVLVCAAAPGPDALPSLDAKAGAGDRLAVDPRIAKMVGEAWRHCKTVAAVGEGGPTLRALGVPAEAPGVVTGDSGSAVAATVLELLAQHRAWHRFATAAD